MAKDELSKFLEQTPLNDSLLIGFYGGGNYGDELLMEVLAGLLKKRQVQDVSIAYRQPELYDKFHHEFGYGRVDIQNPLALIGAILKKRRIVIGGGGLWGMDTNLNVFLMSLMLLFARRVLFKKVYLLSVGFYNSAPRLGRAGAWCAAKAANQILARDGESFTNFKHFNQATRLSSDIAWGIETLDLSAYQNELVLLEQKLKITGKTLFATLRRFRSGEQDHLKFLIENAASRHADKPVIIALMEPRHVDPAGYRALKAYAREHPNVQVTDFGFNPLVLYLFFKKYHDRLIFIGPQFHGILSAHLAGVPYLPIAYDNKVAGLLANIAPDSQPINLKALGSNDIETFIQKAYGEV
jgi:polysaccharide pyruvyl transferase WcaK-like protein